MPDMDAPGQDDPLAPVSAAAERVFKLDAANGFILRQAISKGSFTERTSEAGLVGETGALNIQQTDYNNDGFLDIWMLRGAWLGKAGRIPSSLLRNNGDGTFTDVTEEAGLMSFHPTQTSRWIRTTSPSMSCIERFERAT